MIIGALGTVTKELIKGLEDFETRGWIETIQTTAWLRTARIQRRVQEAWGDLLSLKLQWKTISKCWCENPSRNNNNNNNNDKTQQNSKCRLCGDRDETTNHIISECSKLA